MQINPRKPGIFAFLNLTSDSFMFFRSFVPDLLVGFMRV